MGRYSSEEEMKKRKKKKKRKSRSRSRSHDSVGSRYSSKHKKNKKSKRRKTSRSPSIDNLSRRSGRRRSRSRSRKRSRSLSYGRRSRSRDKYSRRSRSRSYSRRSRSRSYGRRSRSRSYDRGSRSRSFSRRSRSRSYGRRSRSLSRERYSKKSKRRSRSRSRDRSSRGKSPSRSGRGDIREDPCANVPGFSDMTVTEQTRVRMNMALKAAAAADEKLKENQYGQKCDSPVSFKNQEKFVNTVAEIESNEFVPTAFKSSRQDRKYDDKKNMDEFAFGTVAEIKIDPTKKFTIPTDITVLAHPNLSVDPEEKMDRWIEKLKSMRRKKLEGEAIV